MKTMDFSETIAAIDLKASRSRHLIEYIRGVFQKYAERYDRNFAITASLMIFHLRHA